MTPEPWSAEQNSEGWKRKIEKCYVWYLTRLLTLSFFIHHFIDCPSVRMAHQKGYSVSPGHRPCLDKVIEFHRLFWCTLPHAIDVCSEDRWQNKLGVAPHLDANLRGQEYKYWFDFLRPFNFHESLVFQNKNTSTWMRKSLLEVRALWLLSLSEIGWYPENHRLCSGNQNDNDANSSSEANVFWFVDLLKSPSFPQPDLQHLDISFI